MRRTGLETVEKAISPFPLSKTLSFWSKISRL
jgi:hypothetical protein